MTTFKQIKLIAPLQRALDEANYLQPTTIQEKTIPVALKGLDVLGCAQTGTGKTAAFALPILDYLGSQPGKALPRKPYALILAPTRELAIQIGKSFETYGKHLKLTTSVVYGGVHQSTQVRSLQRGIDILVATPGRLLDLMQQGHVELDQLEIFVLDEADRMLDMGFLPDLRRIIQRLPDQRQSLFFSATLSPKITELAKQLLFEPVVVNVTPKTRSVDKIEQQMLLVQHKDKPRRLNDILMNHSVKLAVVFTRTKRAANKVEKALKQHGIEAAAIHGNKSQTNRQRTLDSFREGRIQVLVATDIAARGIDVSDVSHVVNYDLPADPESYIHRIGRTGRAGAGGTAITFYTADQRQELQAIERFTGVRSKDSSEGDTRSRSKRKPHASNKMSGRRAQPNRHPKNQASPARSANASSKRQVHRGASPARRVATGQPA